MDHRSDHLLVLIHGLWGNVSHFDYVCRAIDQYYTFDDIAPQVTADNDASTTEPAGSPSSDSSNDVKPQKQLSDEEIRRRIESLCESGKLAKNSKYRKPYVLVTRSNEGYLTYDGIDMCGEKVALEIEQALDNYERQGIRINKISITGYSLGGLMARYAIGLLYQRGIFKKVTPVNFTTFCTPHIGVRAPGKGLPTTIFNTCIPRTFSATGRQLFQIDKFSTFDRPLMSLLADKSSIFYHALLLFSNHALYANIVNDRRTSWFTAGISHTDPFVDLHNVSVNYLPGYEPTLVDVTNPISPILRGQDPDMNLVSGTSGLRAGVSVLPAFFMTLLNLFIISPIYVLAYLISAAIQTFYSSRRLREFHSKRKGRYGMDEFRFLNIDEQIEDVVDTVLGDFIPYSMSHSHVDELMSEDNSLAGTFDEKNYYHVPPLEITDLQSKMIQSLNTVPWKKFPVHITKTKAAHAAVIVRHMDWKGMEEGEVVIRHWLSEVLVM
ncbi:putative serine esterase-domain-containing protein [Myxozyma melibiosi]|uniref:Serine esterase-domain-containing protein n=1 Tax=Myxozyma melibiosi TaxID=54550 RepID=A0ABR1FBP2_9ASCO